MLFKSIGGRVTKPRETIIVEYSACVAGGVLVRVILNKIIAHAVEPINLESHRDVQARKSQQRHQLHGVFNMPVTSVVCKT